MGQIRVILTGISTSNDFRVYYKRDDTGYGPYPITGPSWLNYPNEMDPDGIFPASTSVIRLYETVVTFDNDYVYWIKLEDVNDSKRYLIKNIKIHGDNFCPDIQVTPTVTPTISITPTPSSTPQMTPTPSLSPQASPTPSPTQGVSITPSPSLSTTPSISMSLSPTRTPSVSQSASVDSEIYFASLSGNDVVMGVNNAQGRTFNINLYYHLTAEVDNNRSCNPNIPSGNALQTTTRILVSTNGGATWTNRDSVRAEIPGGDCQDDYQEKFGYTTITNITNVSQVKVRIEYDCYQTQDISRGTGYVTISSAIVVNGGGNAVVICNDEFSATCDNPNEPVKILCGGLPPSPMPSPPPPSPSSTPTRALIVVENNAAIPSISNVMVNDGPISSGGFPLTYLGILTGSTSDLGSQNIDIYITYWEGGSNYIKLTDSNNVTYYSSLIGETPGGEITHIIPSIYISLSRPVRLSLEDGTPPSPSVTPSVTRTVTRTPSPSFGASTTPSRTVTPTPTPSPFGPTVIIYNMGTYNINEVTIGTITVSGINFPIVPSTWAMGHTTVYSTNTVVDVMLNQGSIGESVSVNNSCVESQGEGTFTFIGVDTTTGPVTITYAMGSCE